MKKLVVTLLALLPLLIFAQTEGIIQFKETISLDIELPEGMEAFASQIPSSKTMNMILSFNEDATLYESAKNNEAEDVNMGSADEGVMINMKFDMPENKTFTNIADGTMVNKQDFMGKKFLIQGKVEKYKWKLTGEQETILGYVCQKATYKKDSTHNFVAWFTPQIPVATGPRGISGLPGMILKLDMDDGKIVTEATAVELKKLEKGTIKAPKKGKKVSKEEFEKIQEEKLKEMEEQFGASGSGGTRIIIQN